ncbi:hypothetical protein BLNAU_9889 [Blattamonas nauphoetae]|uniref:Uncharacterized protein n=1 Tax=Blattamonas nauphoetae TaxID=2049346 RepID=A0ABQ9XUL5_9EUKA|nr:hypothetical protein BLNAU_9889 [Blattamonas nauphoetae]
MTLFTRTVKEVLSAGTDDLFGLNNKSGYLESISSPLTISNGRLERDGKSYGDCLNIVDCEFGSGGLSISDANIVNTSSLIEINTVSGVQNLKVARSTLVSGSLSGKHSVFTQQDPLHCVLVINMSGSRDWREKRALAYESKARTMELKVRQFREEQKELTADIELTLSTTVHALV